MVRLHSIETDYDNAVPPSGENWYCLRTKPRQEPVAAAHLRSQGVRNVLNPLIRYARSTRRGPVFITEPLFPAYLFARFNRRTDSRLVCSANGVTGIVHFGNHWPSLPDGTIKELRSLTGDPAPRVVSPELIPGDEVEISGGVFHGLKALLLQIRPARDRARVLMDFLGQPACAELPMDALLKPRWHPQDAPSGMGKPLYF